MKLETINFHVSSL